MKNKLYPLTHNSIKLYNIKQEIGNATEDLKDFVKAFTKNQYNPPIIILKKNGNQPKFILAKPI